MKLLTPKAVLIVTAVVTIFLLLALAQEMNRRWQVQREVSRLEEEVGTMEKRVVELEQLNDYFRTSAYLERVAREKLNYRAPGEHVVLIPEDAAIAAEPSEGSSPEHSVAVWERWWRVFFVEEDPLYDILTTSS